MIPFKIDNISFQLPQHHGELTMKQFLALRRNNSDSLLDTLSILSGVPVDTWNQASDIDIDIKIAPALDWLRERFDYNTFLRPSTITISGKSYAVPDSIGVKTFGQKIALQKHYKKAATESKDLVDAFCIALAIYFQPEITGSPFSEDEALRVVSQIEECRLDEVYPVASFFLKSWIEYLKERNESLASSQQPNKKGLASIALKSLRNSALYIICRKALIKIMTPFYAWIITRYSLRFGLKQKFQDSKQSTAKY